MNGSARRHASHPSSARVIRAHVRLALVQGRRGFLLAVALAAVLLALTALLPMTGLVVALLTIGVLLLLLPFFGPLATLGAEKMTGTLELDRTLPVPLRTIAGGRLAGAAVRSSPAIAFLVAMVVAVARAFEGMDVGVLLSSAIVALALYWSMLWTMYAVAARFSLRWLSWIGVFAWLIPMAVPDRVWDALGARVTMAGRAMFVDADASSALLATVALIALGLAASAFLAAQALLVHALRHYRHEATALDRTMGKVPKREMAAAGRGAMLAVTRLRLRLASHRFRNEVILFAVLVAIIIADVDGLSDFARTYLPIFASIMPTMIAIQLLQDRVHGALEGFQQLPHPRRSIALGHLLAVAIISVPAAVAWSVARASSGGDLGWPVLLRQYLTFVAIGHVMAAIVVWGTAKRLLIALGVVVGLIVAIVAMTILVARARGGAITVDTDAAPPLLPSMLVAAGALVAIVVATMLFAHGLATYRRAEAKA